MQHRILEALQKIDHQPGQSKKESKETIADRIDPTDEKNKESILALADAINLQKKGYISQAKGAYVKALELDLAYRKISGIG